MATLGHRITGSHHIPLTDPQIDQYIQELTFSNPFEPDKDFQAFFRSPTHLIVPRAFTPKFEGIEVNVVDAPCNIETAKGYALRDYQEQAVDEIVEYFRIRNFAQLLLQAPCGAGKTFMLSGLFNKLNQRVLILSHLSMLSTQMHMELTQGTSNTSIKILESSDINKELPDLAICTFQLLQNHELLLKVREHYGIVVVDEADNAFTRSRLKVLFSLKPKYQIYMTATPSKDLMKQTSGLFYLFGNKLIEMVPPNANKVHSHHLVIDFDNLRWDSPGNTNLYKTSLGKFMLRSGICKQISQWAYQLKQEGLLGTQWIIADLSAVQDYFEEQLVSLGLTVRIIRGTTSSKKRAIILQEIMDGKVDVLIGSAPLAAGISIKELSVGWRVMPNSSSEELLEQQKGRLARPIEFKETQTPIWVDFRIPGNLEYGIKKRYKLYQQSTLGVSLRKPQDTIKTIKEKIWC